MSYADRYFRIPNTDISYVTFSIVTAFNVKELNDVGQEIERHRWNMSLGQCKASEFVIVTFPSELDRIALLPRRVYRPVEEDEGTDIRDTILLPEGTGHSIWEEYSFSITLLIAAIDEVRRITANPMHPTTTPFQIGLDGIIPKADFPKDIMPLGSERINELHAERKMRTIHKQFPRWYPKMAVEFLDYQPLMRDFKFVISPCGNFPNGLEAVISYGYGHSKFPDDKHKDHLRCADYVLTHGIMLSPQVLCSDRAFFIPRRLIPEEWFTTRHPNEYMPKKLFDSGRRVSDREFVFNMDGAGRWSHEIWKIMSKYPPDESPTPAEKRQEMWKKAFPWPEVKAQVGLAEVPTPQKVHKENEQPALKRDSGTGGKDTEKPSDVSLLATHYMAQASLDGDEAQEDV